MIKRRWDFSKEDVRQKCIEEILTHLDEQQGEAFGIIAAEDIIDIVLHNAGPDIYNAAIADARQALQSKMDDLATDIDLLQAAS